MIHFTKLRLSGFKSFVDPVELLVEPGMTGVVGPNGCGKSNLIEALRWVMGETSARQMRGGEMDDVIFGGTSGRPARNLAEVAVVLDNRARSAPPHYDADDLEICRRIERGQGSNYRINSRDVRARDVQLLFADTATGARSSGLVSQGRIGALISAKAGERRSLLEEAAGISGLYSRRHEAELRLKNAEGNLARLDDVLVTLEDQLRGLQRQARQAQRYRNLSDQIRELEARLLYLQWLEALTVIDAARAMRTQAETRVQDATRLAAAAAAAAAQAAAGLPELRRQDAEVQALLQRVLVEREHLESEAGRLAETRRDLESRLAQAQGDLHKEHARAEDAQGAVARLAAEEQAIMEAAQGEDDARAEADERVEQAAQSVAALEKDLARLMEEVAAADAGRAAALRRQQDSETRRDRLRDRVTQAENQRAQAAQDGVDRSDLTAAEMDLESALEYLEESRAEAEEGDRRRVQAQADLDRSRDQLQTARAAHDRLAAEADALASVLEQSREGAHAPALDQVSAVSGHEPALAAALGDDLLAALDDGDAPMQWRILPPLDPSADPLPEGAVPLGRWVSAPQALARRLSQVGVAPDAPTAQAMQAGLRPGQRVVTPDGGLWRWDGYHMRPGAPSPMALRLAQRNRLDELRAGLDDAVIGLENAEETVQAALAAAEDAHGLERAAKDAVRRAEAETAKARDVHAKLSQRFAAHESRMAGLDEQVAAARADLEDAEAEVMDARQAVADLPQSADDGKEHINALRADLAEARTGLVESRSALDRLVREAGERRRRLDSLAGDMESWRRRADAALQQMEELAERREGLMAELDRLSSMPDSFDRRRSQLLDRIAEAEAARRASADHLAQAEAAQAESDRAQRAAEAQLSQAREDRIRQDAAVEGADRQCRAVAARIAERLEMTPEQLRDLAGVVEEERPAMDDLQSRLDRLNRERDAMGPVNLRAEQEVAELDERLTVMKTEKEDLVQAIAKLRGAIGELNREGREKLLTSFQQVDQHFRDLFVRLFGGGRAHLALTESPDPLEAGLEIMASPPGKRLQVLSLLSGGEQALTALALIFAVFLINPAPICVLDEVDAPLDDANVDRFCALVSSIAQTTRTRFLIVTHHRMTMARMDRLYGVTMAERGVSQLVSVDLAQAESIRES